MISSRVVTVTDAAVRLDFDADDKMGGKATIIKFEEGSTSTVFVGGADVDVTDGWPWVIGDGALAFELDSDEEVWGVCNSGETAVVHVLSQGV